MVKTLRYIALAACTVCATASAQVSGVPGSLSGRWTDPNGNASHSVSLSIDAASGTGKLTVWSNNSRCTMHDAPATVTKAGNEITVIISKEYSNPCRDNVSMVISKKEGSDDYEGEIRQNVPGYPVLKVKLSP